MKFRYSTLCIMFAALLFGLLFWLADAVYEYYRFAENLRFLLYEEPMSLMDSLIFNIPPHAIFNRFAFMLACLIGGLLVAVFFNQLKHSERALRESEERFRGLFDHTLNGVVLMDAVYEDDQIEDLVVFSANPSIRQHLGVSPHQVLGKRTSDILDDQDLHILKQSLREVQDKQEGITREEYSTTFNRYLDMMLFEISPDRYALVFSDITDRKRAEEEQRQLENQMQNAQKLESLGILAGGIAHDFNNLLMAIMGNADLIAEDLPQNSPMRYNVLEIETASKRASELCNQMLAYSGKGCFVIEFVDINQLIQGIAGIIGVTISKKVSLLLKLEPHISPVRADAGQMRQVVMNLVTNASEAIDDEDGAIVITSGERFFQVGALENPYSQELLPAGDYVFFRVQDDGPGMSPDTLEKVYDPFFTTKFTGRGLGLAAVLGIIQGHKGAIHIHSQLGEGTTFTVYFPACKDEKQIEEAGPPAAAEPPEIKSNGQGPVLLVDDERGVREIGERLLKRLGFLCQTATNGREAVEMVQRNPDDYACVILDLMMPEMDGEEAFREIHRIRPDLPVIISSGYSQQEFDKRFWLVQPSAFLQKPYRRDTLELELRRAMGT
ncbi:MAG: hybrid sensor histidine kinase/response regulator [Candidatus Sumerlaeota bacterium]